MKLKSSFNWEMGIGILEDNVFGLKAAENVESQQDRRREPRISLSLPIRYRPKSGLFGWTRGQSLDVSRNGIRLSLDVPVPVGTSIELDVKLPEVDNTVKLEGVIVWSRRDAQNPAIFEAGVAFQNLRKLSNKERIMHFMADKICGLAHNNSKEMTARPAVTLAEHKEAYRMLYREYAARGYCEKNSSEIHYAQHCFLPESRTFLLERDKKLLGTISLLVDSPWGLPLDSLFHSEINGMRAKGRKLAEVGLLALNGESFDKKSFSLTDFQKLTGSFRLFKVMFDYARLVAGVTDLVIGMHPKHRELYEYLTFQAMGPVKAYPGACGKPALLMGMDINYTIQTISGKKGAGYYFLKDPTPEPVVKRHYSWTPEALETMLCKERDLLSKFSPGELKFLKKCYPNATLGNQGS